MEVDLRSGDPAALKVLEIGVARILDVVGRDVAPAKPEAEYLASPVLMQLPEPGQPVPGPWPPHQEARPELAHRAHDVVDGQRWLRLRREWRT